MTLVLSHATLPEGGTADIVIENGHIVALAPAGTAEGPVEDCTGLTALPGLVESHIHLDKTLLGMPFQAHPRRGGVAERIEFERRTRPTLAPVFDRGMALVRQVAAYGTTQIRTHVDIDGLVKLDQLHALLRLREAVSHLADIQIVAFPQNGILRDPGVADLLDAALAEGADLVGGLDPAGIDGDVKGHLDVVFGLAEKHGKGVDIHLHDGGTLGLFELSDFAKRTEAAGLQDSVAVSHAFALGDPAAGPVIDALAKAGISIITNCPARAVPMPPVRTLHAAGVRVVAGSDNIRDLWNPHGNGDILHRATLIAYMQGLTAPDDLALALDLATTHGAALQGLKRYGIAQGNPADLVLVRAGSAAEAVVGFPLREMVLKNGRITARNGRLED